MRLRTGDMRLTFGGPATVERALLRPVTLRRRLSTVLPFRRFRRLHLSCRTICGIRHSRGAAESVAGGMHIRSADASD